MTWTPQIVQAVLSIAVMVGIGLAVFGQVRWRATQEWEALADARLQRINLLEQEVTMLRARGTAQEGQISEVQRLNLELQRANSDTLQKLERLERSLMDKGAHG